MKHLHVTLENKLYDRLRKRVYHHGHLTHIVREAIELYLSAKEEAPAEIKNDSQSGEEFNVLA